MKRKQSIARSLISTLLVAPAGAADVEYSHALHFSQNSPC